MHARNFTFWGIHSGGKQNRRGISTSSPSYPFSRPGGFAEEGREHAHCCGVALFGENVRYSKSAPVGAPLPLSSFHRRGRYTRSRILSSQMVASLTSKRSALPYVWPGGLLSPAPLGLWWWDKGSYGSLTVHTKNASRELPDAHVTGGNKIRSLVS